MSKTKPVAKTNGKPIATASPQIVVTKAEALEGALDALEAALIDLELTAATGRKLTPNEKNRRARYIRALSVGRDALEFPSTPQA